MDPENSTGELSVDQAVGLLNEQPEEQQQTESTNPADASSTPADATGAETPTEGESDPNAEAETPIDAPRSWNAEAKAKFAELPRDQQEFIAQREGEREAAFTKAQMETAELRKRADTEFGQLGQFKAQLDQLLPKAQEMFQHRWGKVDWVQLTTQIGAEEATKLRFQYENEQAELQRLSNAQQVASAISFQKYVEAEGEKLKSLAPELADPKDGATRRAAVGQFLVESGIPTEALRGISAAQLAIAYDAMRYRQAQKAIGTKPTVAPAKAPAARPTAAKPQTTSQKSRVAALYEKAYATGRREDMIAAMNAESGV